MFTRSPSHVHCHQTLPCIVSCCLRYIYIYIYTTSFTQKWSRRKGVERGDDVCFWRRIAYLPFTIYESATCRFCNAIAIPMWIQNWANAFLQWPDWDQWKADECRQSVGTFPPSMVLAWRVQLENGASVTDREKAQILLGCLRNVCDFKNTQKKRFASLVHCIVGRCRVHNQYAILKIKLVYNNAFSELLRCCLRNAVPLPLS